MRESYKEWNKAIKDQAHSLRMTDFTRKRGSPPSITRVISFTSGKGGVGKTNSVVNVGVSLAQQGRSVLILDADLGLANVDVMLGLTPHHTLYDVVEGRRSLEDVILDGPEGTSIIPAASGVESICNLSSEQRYALMQAIEEVAGRFDYLLIDTRAGISPDVMHFNTAAAEVVCVITADPTSLTDAYALIKILVRNYKERSVSILVNNISAGSHGEIEAEAMQAYTRLASSVHRFLNKEQVELKYLGYVPADKSVSEAIRNQKAVMQLFPSSSASRALNKIALRMDDEFTNYRVKGGMQFFFQQLVDADVRNSVLR